MPASAIFMPQRARRNNMDYFYEHESELFTFYRVPKVLFTEESFKNMNCEAKLLYGLLLDKMGLSRTVPPEIRKPNFLTFDFRISRTLKISALER